MRKVNFLLALGIGSSLVTGGVALAADALPPASHDAAAMSAADRRFVMDAAQGGMAEVQLGKLAEERATRPEVKEFARRMIDDHTRVNDQLRGLAERRGVSLPTKIDAKDQMTYDRLAKLSGADFDNAYMEVMMRDHDADVAEFRRQAETAKDKELQEFAARTLPTLQRHDELAHKLANPGSMKMNLK